MKFNYSVFLGNTEIISPSAISLTVVMKFLAKMRKSEKQKQFQLMK